MKRVDEKLARIRAGQYQRQDFIIADAKDPDMGPAIPASGPKREPDGSWTRYRTRPEFLDQVRAYHGELQKQHHKPLRALQDDLPITETVLQR